MTRIAARTVLSFKVMVLVVVLVGPDRANGAEEVFGPASCVRLSGSPSSCEFPFSVENPDRGFVVQVLNGGLEDDQYDKVSSSVITLNGSPILGTENFNQQVDLLEVPVTLVEQNLLQVEVRGKPGGAITLRVLPLVVIDYPREGQIFGSEPIIVSGRVFYPTIGLDINSIAVEVSGGAFSLAGVSLSEGGNMILATAVTDKGLVGSDRTEVVLDSEPPELEISYPPDGLVTNETVVPVLKVVDGLDPDPVSTLTPAPPYTADGSYEITLTAVDWAGNTSRETRSFIVDMTPPRIDVVSPAAGQLVSEPTLTVSGSVADDSGIPAAQLLVNSSPPRGLLLDERGHFNTEATLEEGENTVEVRAIDAAGNESGVSRNVTYESLSLPVAILSPKDGDVIHGGNFDIHGAYRHPVERIMYRDMPQEAAGGEFVITGLPLKDGHRAVTVVGYDSEGNAYEDAVAVECTSAGEPLTLKTDRPGGDVPLTVTFNLENHTSEVIAAYEIDFEGRGDYVTAPEGVDGLAYTYERPRLYQPSVRVTTAEGHHFTASGFVSAHGPARLMNSFPVTDPVGLAVGGEERLYVLEGAPAKVRVFDGEGGEILTFGSHGSGEGQFVDPSGIDIAADGSIYVSDTGNDRVQVFSSDGTFLRSWGIPGSNAGEISRPQGIAVRFDGEVILADTGNGRVGRFQGDGSFENTVGAYDLAEPRGVVWAGADEVAVSDREGGTVRIFSAEGSAESWEGDAPAFVAPAGLTYDAANRTYVVADEGRNSVVFFMDNRGFPVFIRSVENVVGDTAGLSRPVDVVKSNSPVDDIYYVADNGNGRIVKIILPAEDAEGPKEVWEDLRTALVGEDLEDALQFFSPRTRDVYRELLMSIGGNVDVLINDMGDLLPLRITRDRAVYGLLRYDNGKPYLFDVVFARDGRGDWKIVNW